jgi:hypothetical protein
LGSKQMPPKSQKHAGEKTRRKRSNKHLAAATSSSKKAPISPSQVQIVPPRPTMSPEFNVPILLLKMNLLQVPTSISPSFDLCLPADATLANLSSALIMRHGPMKDLTVYVSRHPPRTLDLHSASNTTLANCELLMANAVSMPAKTRASIRTASFSAQSASKTAALGPTAHTRAKDEAMMVIFLYYDFTPAIKDPLLDYVPSGC